jgi:putative ABC transport system permease protein
MISQLREAHLFTNYLKIAARNLVRRKAYSALIMIGLAVGMSCSIVIFLYVQQEMSTDRFNGNHERIYRLLAERRTPTGTKVDATLPPPLTVTVAADVPQIQSSVRLLTMDNPIPLIANGEKRFYEKQLFFSDSTLANVFSVQALRGDLRNGLNRANTVIITEEIARKYFGADDPLGKTLNLNGIIDLEVTAVVRRFPANSSIQPDLLVSFATLEQWLGKDFTGSWQNNTCEIYVLLVPNSSAEEVSRRLTTMTTEHLGNNSPLQTVHLQPMDRIHLYSFRDFGLASSGDIQSILILTGIALLVLIVACVNFANLTTARLVLRSKEVGVRKLIGATRGQLVQQFFVEALLSITVSLLVSVAVVELSIPYLGALMGSETTTGMASEWQSWLLPLAAVFLIGVLATIYPAFVLSSLRPLETAKGFSRSGSHGVILRKAMVVVQFALTVILIVGAWVVYDQLRFVQRAQLGLNKDRVIIVPIRNQNLRQNCESLKRRLMERPGVQQVGAAALLPGGPVGRTRFRVEGSASEGTMSMLWVDKDFGPTLDLKLVAGRQFSADYATDATEGFMINEQAVKQLGWESPAAAIGMPFELVGGKKGHIVGVLKDFNFASLHRKIDPLVIHIWPWMNYILIRVDQSHPGFSTDDLKDTFNEFDPINPFTFTYLNDNFDRSYAPDRQLGQVFGSFALLAILIACSGLVSLAAFSAEQRRKEIGVRKVLGASVAGIIRLMTREYLLLVLLSNVFAWPVAYLVMSRWLQDFAYRVEIGVVSFIVPGVVSVFIAMMTVSYQAMKAATSSPVEAIQYE